jgi:signal transduction histidine kinase
MAEQSSSRKKRRPGSGADPRLEPASAVDTGPSSLEPDRVEPATLTEAMARIEVLEAELATANAAVMALLDQAERQVERQAERQAERRRSAAMTGVKAEPVHGRSGSEAPSGLVNELDTLVKQRTRALAESEEQLRRKNFELEQINETKVEFIAIATHELRTPLTSIVGYLDLMTEGCFGELPTAMERPMASLRRNALRLKRLVDEMLDVSRIDAGRVTLYRTRCDIGTIVREAVEELEPQARAKRLELTAIIDGPPEIYADVNKIRQAASKLLANAVRNTPEGGAITVTVDAAPQDHFAGVWARLRVKGTGISIPKHLRNRIFEPFSAMHTARHHTSSGPDSAGLGLYISRGLIDLHGGLISVESQEGGAYTEFTVLLPLSEPSPGEEIPAGAPAE